MSDEYSDIAALRENVVHHISSTRPIAKKEYTCHCCNRPITKGQKHYKFVYKLGKDDKIRWERSHIQCGYVP